MYVYRGPGVYCVDICLPGSGGQCIHVDIFTGVWGFIDQHGVHGFYFLPSERLDISDNLQYNNTH